VIKIFAKKDKRNWEPVILNLGVEKHFNFSMVFGSYTFIAAIL